jgi:integrase
MSLFKRTGQKYYSCELTVKGKRVLRTTKTANLKDARLFEARLRIQLEQEFDRIEAGELKLSEALDRIFEQKWRNKRTKELQFQRVQAIIQLCGDVYLSAIDGPYLQKLRVLLAKEGRSGATINRYLAHLRAVIHFARDRLGAQVRSIKFDMQKETPRQFVLTWAQEVSMLSTLRAEGTRLPPNARRNHFPEVADFFAVLLDTGMRLNEALQANFQSNINLEEGTITLYPEMVKTGECRVIPLTDRVKGILSARRDRVRPFELSKDQIEGVVKFLRFNGVITDANFCVHGLRHTFASRLVQNGVDIYTVSKLLGHKSVKTTEKYYAHLDLGSSIKAIGRLNALNGHLSDNFSGDRQEINVNNRELGEDHLG